jgi:pimeloyl-ACP methyl ester carboxylesterase
MESQADDIHALLAGMGALPCVLGGLSMGGYVAFAFARKYARDLRGLILVDTRAEADTAEGKAGRQKMIDLVRASGSAAIADQMMPKMLHADAAQKRPQLVQSLHAIMTACPPETIENALAAMRDRPHQVAALATISTPTLVVVGEGDAITPVSMAQTMHKGIAGSRLAVIQGAGHMAPMEQPSQVNQAIRQFIQSLSETGAA